MRKINRYEGLYHFDEDLNIVNTKRNTIKTQQILNNGYYVVDLYKKGKRTTELVHRLVAETFINNPNNYRVVNHIDGNKLNNDVNNLEWCTPSYNAKHAYEVLGRKCWMKGLMGINNHNSKKIDMYKDGIFVRTFNSIMDIERSLGILNTSVCNNLSGRTNSAGGYNFKYNNK